MRKFTMQPQTDDTQPLLQRFEIVQHHSLDEPEPEFLYYISCSPACAAWLEHQINIAARVKEGGEARTEAKAVSARENGKKGGRPKKKV